jgi:hypothetical protein
MKAIVDADSLARILCGLRLGDAHKLKKGQKKEDVVMVTICAQGNRLYVQLETWDTVLTAWNSAKKRWDNDVACYTVTAEVYAKVTEEGARTLSLARAKAIAKFCGRGDVELCTNGSTLEIAQGVRKSHIYAESCGMISSPGIGVGAIVPRGALCGVIGSYAAPDDTRSCLHQWVAVEPGPAGTSISWTDGAQAFWQVLDPDLPSGRVLVPLFAIECLNALKPEEDAVECTPTGIRCGSCCVTYLEQAPSYPHTLDVVRQTALASGYTEVKTTCEDLRAMLEQLSSCMHDEVVISATDGRLHMLAYDNRGEHTRAKRTRFEDCPRAETYVEADVERPFGAIGLSAPRLKKIVGQYHGVLTLRVLDADSPIFINIENSGIRTVLMTLRPSFNKTTID